MTARDTAHARRREHIVIAAQLACLLEVAAPKPGNVSPQRDFHDVRYHHFLASATAIGPSLARAFDRGIGATVLEAITATMRWTPSNTNLGIVLLLTPLVKAAGHLTHDAPLSATTVRPALRRVLVETTVQDAREVYAAIRLAAPGGLGTAPAHDVSGEPTVDLATSMRESAGRDTIASEYASAFDVTFSRAWPALTGARRDGLSWNDTVVETFLTVLAHVPDTHISRRAGAHEAQRVSEHAQRVLEAGGVRTHDGRRAVAQFDLGLSDATNRLNPGTSADLTCAALFLALLEGSTEFTDTVST